MTAVIRFDPVRWDPLNELEEIQKQFNRVVGRMPARREVGREAMTVADWVPTVDVAEDEKEYLLKAELPEIDKKDVKVTVQDGVLILQGERKKEITENNKKFHRIERQYGTFLRSFALPEDVAEDKIRAEFKDGMLMLHLPKTEKPSARAVEVKVE